MFVKIYRYRIRKNKFQKWKKNNDIVTKLYKKYGGEFRCLVKKENNFPHIVELGFYKSKKEFLKIMMQFDSNPKADLLFKEFLNLIVNKKFTEEEFETI